MSIFDNIRNGMINFLFPDRDDVSNERSEEMQERRDYREGRHKQQIKPKFGRTDDNVYINFSGLVIDRSISMLFGKGIEFDLPGEGDDTPEDLFIDETWDANKQEIFLHRMALLASEDGTGFVKIVPDGMFHNEKQYPRLVNIDPKWVTMDTNPEDFEQVIRYTIRFNTVGLDGKELARKQVHEVQDNETWLVVDSQASGMTGGKWVETNREVWPYNFAQIVHFQNLPSADSVYGTPDLTDDLIKLQDKLNFVASNINKIIRLHAHPQLYTTLNSAQKDIIDASVGEMIGGMSADGFIKSVEMQSDLSSSSNYFTTLRQAFFDISRTVDIDSIGDKLGALTNFGLKVLYQDAINKIETKRQLYGDALLEINRRLLTINGMNPDPGEIIWHDALPENGLEVSNELKTDIEMGILDKQSASDIKGYDYQQVQERLQEEQTNNSTVGNEILKLFDRGGGAQFGNQNNQNNQPGNLNRGNQ